MTLSTSERVLSFSVITVIAVLLVTTFGVEIEATKPEEEADYVIYPNGSLIMARSGKTGTTDFFNSEPSVVLNTAIQNLPNGGKILIKEGKYILSETVFLRSNIELKGSGVDITILKLRDHAGTNTGDMLRGGKPPYDLHDGVRNVTISDMTLDGNKANNPYLEVWNRQNPIYFQWSSDIKIERVKVLDGTCVNIHLDTCNNTVLRNLLLYDAGWDGIHLGDMDDHGFYSNINATIENVYCEGSMGYASTQHGTGWTGGSGVDIGKSENVEIRGIRVVNVGAKAVYLDQVTNAKIEGCEAENTNIKEVSGAYTFCKCANIQIENCLTNSSRQIGIEVAESVSLKIRKSIVTQPMSCGVSLVNCSSTEVVGNNITGIGTENNGIRIRDSENVYVKQNIVTGFGDSIDLGGSRFLTVENNSFVGAGHLGICLSYSCPGLGIHQNNILKSDSARYALYNYGISDWVHAESNWWGTANEDEAMTMIPQVQKILWEPISQNENPIDFE